jgi:hypothetical protein
MTAPADDWRPLARQSAHVKGRPAQVRRINDALTELRAAVIEGDLETAARALAVFGRARGNASPAERLAARAQWDQSEE